MDRGTGMGAKIIAWDFDGVLNKNVEHGVFVWKRNFERDIGVPEVMFSEFVFRSGRFAEVLIGNRDIRDLVAEWVDHSGCLKSPDEILDYWFEKDALPDTRMIGFLKRAAVAGFRNVIATNNEARRASFIEHEMGFGVHTDRIFAAGPMGVKKPDPQFFRQIQTEMDVSPSYMLLIDDARENTEAASALGWQAFQFEPGAYDALEDVIFGGGAQRGDHKGADHIGSASKR